MNSNQDHTITDLLRRWREDDKGAFSDLQKKVHGELVKVARSYVRSKSQNLDMHTGTLIQETYVALLEKKDLVFDDRKHFYCLAAKLMRRILTNQFRRDHACKRGGHLKKVSLPADGGEGITPSEKLHTLDKLLERINGQDPLSVKIVELRFYAGFTIKEVAEILGIAPVTVNRKWEFTKNWLYHQLREA